MGGAEEPRALSGAEDGLGIGSPEREGQGEDRLADEAEEGWWLRVPLPNMNSRREESRSSKALETDALFPETFRLVVMNISSFRFHCF